MKKHLISLLLTLVSMAGFAQNLVIQKVIRDNNSAIEQGESIRDLDLYPNTASGDDTFLGLVNTNCISVTLTAINSQTLATPRIIAANCNNIPVSTQTGLRFSYTPSTRALDIEAAPVGGAAQQLKFVAVSGDMPPPVQSSGGQALSPDTYYFPGAISDGAYVQEWSLRATSQAGSGFPPGYSLRLSIKRTSDGQTLTHVLTLPGQAVTKQEIVQSAGTEEDSNDGDYVPGGSVLAVNPGYGNIFGPNSQYTAFSTGRPSGTNNGTEPWARSSISFGAIQVGVNLSAGGVTDVLRWDGGKNVINTYRHSNGKLDAGRSLVGSWYGYPNGGEEGHYTEAGQNTQDHRGPGEPSIGWNPVEPGDEGGNPFYSTVHDFGNDGSRIYKKVQGMQWQLRNVPGQAYTETWLYADPSSDRAMRMHLRLTMFRNDAYASHFPTPRQQEGPCMYHVSDYREYYYCSKKPYTNAPLTRYYTRVPAIQKPEEPIFSTEPAIFALNPGNGRVLAIYAPYSGRYINGDFRFGDNPATNDVDNEAMYMAAAQRICLDRNRVYDFDVSIGEFPNMAAARSWVYNQPRWSGLIETRFDQNGRSRYGFTLHHAQDQLEDNITDGIEVRPLFDNDNRGTDMALEVPERWINGRVVKHLYFKASLKSGTDRFVLRFKKAGDNTEYYHEFTADASGTEKVYDLDLSNNPYWNNKDIVQAVIMHHYNYRVDVSNDVWKFKWISYRNLN